MGTILSCTIVNETVLLTRPTYAPTAPRVSSAPSYQDGTCMADTCLSDKLDAIMSSIYQGGSRSKITSTSDSAPVTTTFEEDYIEDVLEEASSDQLNRVIQVGSKLQYHPYY